MKKKLLYLVLLALSTTYINAQDCTENVVDFGNNQGVASYNITGDVELVYNSSNSTVTLNLGDDFRTASGPDIRAFLVNSNGASNNTLSNTRISQLENIEFGLVGNQSGLSQNGAKTFTITAPSNIEDFDKVFFYCLMFNAFWDFGTYDSFTPENCAILSVEDRLLSENISIFPNPASEFVTIIDKDQNEGQISIFSLLGKQVFQSSGKLNQKINVSSFNKGVYLLNIISEGKTASKKLIVQ